MQKNISLYGTVNLPEMEEAAIQVLRSGRISGGEYVGKFEQGFGQLLGATNVVSTIDMTSAIYLALYLSGVKAGDEVLTLAFCCLSTNAAIAQIGATAVWVDVTPGTVEMDLSDLESKIGPQTKAVILYHVAGYPGPAEKVAEICKKHNITLIEDCNNALFATESSRHVGLSGDFAVYSFYPNRQINTTEGGALVCKSPEQTSKARKLRRFGIDSSNFRTSLGEINPSSGIAEMGWSMTLNNLCSALGYVQLDSCRARQAQVINNVSMLESLIVTGNDIRPIPILPGGSSAYWVCLYFVDKKEQFIKFLKSRGIMASSIHQRNDIYSAFGTHSSSQLRGTAYLQEHLVGVPCGWWLGPSDIEYVAKTINDSRASTEQVMR